MPLLLRNARTGDVHRLDPERSLIGSVEHADVRAPGPLMAGFVVRYPSGWAVHALTDHPPFMHNGRQIPLGRSAQVGQDDVIQFGDVAFRVEADHKDSAQHRALTDEGPTVCHVTVRGPDGMEECRVIDHDLLIGRLPVCHVSYPDKRLSRMNALLASDAGTWYVHNLAKGPIGQNRQRVDFSSPLENGDELLIGPLTVWVGIRAENPPHTPPPAGKAGGISGEATTEDIPGGESPTPAPGPPSSKFDSTPTDPIIAGVREKAKRLDAWLRTQTRPSSKEGRQWVEKVRGFWADAHEATTARSLRNLGRLGDAFALLDTAVRSRPDSQDLLWELYRLYRTAGLADLCYRPLRQIEKVAERRGGKPDPRVLETLAQVCEELGTRDREMFDRALGYWDRLETLTGISYSRERSATMAKQTMRANQFPAHRTSAGR